ncbi:hypothetical protein GF323_02895 [Candidatus Woesearchaeota archaeon]|nr:hypothetical protein [Candidatus Woesearchaeota archaeon]
MEEQNYLLDKKIDYLIKMKVGSMQEQIGSALQQIQSLRQDMDIIRNKVQRMDANPVQTKLAEPAKTQAGEKEGKKGDNARSGSYTPDDVSIEKMFYFGNKG